MESERLRVHAERAKAEAARRVAVAKAAKAAAAAAAAAKDADARRTQMLQDVAAQRQASRPVPPTPLMNPRDEAFHIEAAKKRDQQARADVLRTAAQQKPAAPKVVSRTSTARVRQLSEPSNDSEREWAAGEDLELIRLYETHAPVVVIAQTMQIDQLQVARRLVRVMLNPRGEINDREGSPRSGAAYSHDERAKLIAWHHAGVPLPVIAVNVERTQLGVGWQIVEQGHLDVPLAVRERLKAGKTAISTVWLARQRSKNDDAQSRRPAPAIVSPGDVSSASLKSRPVAPIHTRPVPALAAPSIPRPIPKASLAPAAAAVGSPHKVAASKPAASTSKPKDQRPSGAAFPHRRWSIEEDNQLAAMYVRNADLADIVDEVGVELRQVVHRLVDIVLDNMPHGDRVTWPVEDRELRDDDFRRIKADYEAGARVKAIASAMNTHRDVVGRAILVHVRPRIPAEVVERARRGERLTESDH